MPDKVRAHLKGDRPFGATSGLSWRRSHFLGSVTAHYVEAPTLWKPQTSASSLPRKALRTYSSMQARSRGRGSAPSTRVTKSPATMKASTQFWHHCGRHLAQPYRMERSNTAGVTIGIDVRP